jgi:hypothetical protein
MPLKIPAPPRNPCNPRPARTRPARTRPTRLVFIKCGLRIGNFQPAKVRGRAKKGRNPHRPAPCTPLLADEAILFGLLCFSMGLKAFYFAQKIYIYLLEKLTHSKKINISFVSA